MKQQHTLIRLFSTFSLFLALLSFSSCSKNVRFVNSPVVPAAQGSVKIKKDANDNSVITVKVLHLADPSRLSPPKRVYVVWMNTSANSIVNIGRLKVKSGLFSDTREGQLITSTPYKPERIFITAEEEPNGRQPDGIIVLDTTDF